MADQAVDVSGPRRVAVPDTHEPSFLGRQRELSALRADVERAGLNTISGRKEPRARVLLVAGRPGSGRTALAEEIARRLGEDHPDGVVRVPLTAPDGNPVPVERSARYLLDVLGVTAPPGESGDELTRRVRETLADRAVVLLLDDAVDAEQVDPLVPDNPACLVVAVSRGPLTGIPDVRPCTVGGLDTGAAVALLTRYAGHVRITVDPHAAESLAEECGGQPAALILAGGWLAARPTASVADLARRLHDQPLDPDVPVGDRPLERAFRLAYAALSAPAARLLRLLVLAPAGLVDAQTASALAGCSPTDAADTLRELASLGLLAPGRPAAESLRTATVPARRGAEQDGDRKAASHGRYALPGALVPLVRARAAEQDRPAEVRLARARMLERTVRLLRSCRAAADPDDDRARRALAAVPPPLRFQDRAAAAAWLRTHRPALLAAAGLAVADGALDTLARRLVAALVRALAAHEGTEAAAPDLYGLHHLVLDVAERRGLHRERAAALLNIGDLDARTGRTRDALSRYRAALDAGRAAGDHYATGRAMESVGGAYQDLEEWHRAADWYARALTQRLGRGEHADGARLYARLGAVHAGAGDHAEALRHLRAAVAVRRRLEDSPGQARVLGEVARVQEAAGNGHDALRTYEEALERAGHAADDRLLSALHLRVADTLDRLGDPAAARLHRNRSARLLELGQAQGGTSPAQ